MVYFYKYNIYFKKIVFLGLEVNLFKVKVGKLNYKCYLYYRVLNLKYRAKWRDRYGV